MVGQGATARRMGKGIGQGKHGPAKARAIGLLHVCKSSPGIACILLPDQPRQNETIEEWRGVAYLRSMTEMKGFDP